MTYKARTISGAQRRVRELEKQIAERDALLAQWGRERCLLAMLAAETPQFFNPLEAFQAQIVRDNILKRDNAPETSMAREI